MHHQKLVTNMIRRGMNHMIPTSWLTIFNPPELQFLISGKQGPMDLNDLRKNTKYSNGYHDDHVVIIIFWHVIAGFTPEEQSLLLKFVTACSRVCLI